MFARAVFGEPVAFTELFKIYFKIYLCLNFEANLEARRAWRGASAIQSRVLGGGVETVRRLNVWRNSQRKRLFLAGKPPYTFVAIISGMSFNVCGSCFSSCFTIHLARR